MLLEHLMSTFSVFLGRMRKPKDLKVFVFLSEQLWRVCPKVRKEEEQVSAAERNHYIFKTLIFAQGSSQSIELHNTICTQNPQRNLRNLDITQEIFRGMVLCTYSELLQIIKVKGYFLCYFNFCDMIPQKSLFKHYN